MALTGTVAYAGTNWVVGLNSGSSGQAQSAAITNLSISAVAAPTPTNLLYPGADGDVVLSITNPNSFPVTLTGLTLPALAKNAAGYSDSALTSAVAGCTADGGAAPSLVSWKVTGAKTLGSAVTVDASNSLKVTLTNAATMGLSSPSACANSFFKMPALIAVAASGGAATPTAGQPTETLS
jgi:hypothetical protein